MAKKLKDEKLAVVSNRHGVTRMHSRVTKNGKRRLFYLRTVNGDLYYCGFYKEFPIFSDSVQDVKTYACRNIIAKHLSKLKAYNLEDAKKFVILCVYVDGFGGAINH